jgi:CRP/FNR family cyclic AMP-dependent transcriptional regulator
MPAARGVSVRALEKVPFFIGLTTPQLRQIARLFKERRFAPGEVIVKEGSGGAVFFVIKSGEATVSVRGRKKATLGASDHFGEVSLIDGGERTATITAATDMVCYAMNYWDFRPFVIAHGVIGWKLLQGMAKMLRSGAEVQD